MWFDEIHKASSVVYGSTGATCTHGSALMVLISPTACTPSIMRSKVKYGGMYFGLLVKAIVVAVKAVTAGKVMPATVGLPQEPTLRHHHLH